MAKYLITHACGCEQTIQLFGKSSERDWRIQKEEQKLCPECFAKAQQEERKQAGDWDIPEVTEADRKKLERGKGHRK